MTSVLNFDPWIGLTFDMHDYQHNNWLFIDEVSLAELAVVI